jgi:hypothetical protein
MKVKGLVFVKHGRVGSRSEGPDYFLQTANGDHILHLNNRNLWEPDYQLEFYARKIVEIEGEGIEQGKIRVIRIAEIPDQKI